jgi:hypothetical protein
MPRIVNVEDEVNYGNFERGHLLLSQFVMPDECNVFAVSLEQPMFKHLQLYGVDCEPNYFWNCLGEMGKTLHEGCKPAIKEAMEAGEHVYAFNRPEDVLEDIETAKNPTPSEIMSLYGCAMTLYEYHYGSDSLQFGRTCWANAEFLRSIGNEDAFRGYGEMASEIIKAHLGDEHPELISMTQRLKQQLNFF